MNSFVSSRILEFISSSCVKLVRSFVQLFLGLLTVFTFSFVNQRNEHELNLNSDCDNCNVCHIEVTLDHGQSTSINVVDQVVKCQTTIWLHFKESVLILTF